MISNQPYKMSKQEKLECIQRLYEEGKISESYRDSLEYLNK